MFFLLPILNLAALSQPSPVARQAIEAAINCALSLGWFGVAAEKAAGATGRGKDQRNEGRGHLSIACDLGVKEEKPLSASTGGKVLISSGFLMDVQGSRGFSIPRGGFECKENQEPLAPGWGQERKAMPGPTLNAQLLH